MTHFIPHFVGVVACIVAVLLIALGLFIFSNRKFLYNDFGSNWVYIAPPVFVVIGIGLIYCANILIQL